MLKYKKNNIELSSTLSCIHYDNYSNQYYFFQEYKFN